MESSVSPKDETWFLRVCHHISNAVYRRLLREGVCLLPKLVCLGNWNDSNNDSVFPQTRVQKLKTVDNFPKIYESISSRNFEVDMPSVEGAFGIITSITGSAPELKQLLVIMLVPVTLICIPRTTIMIK